MTTLPIPDTRMGRLTYVAEVLGVPVPDGLTPDLLDPDCAHAQGVCAFCVETGASLDFIYRGDVRSMIFGDYHSARDARALSAALLAQASVAPASTAAQEAETPVMKLFRQWLVLDTLEAGAFATDCDEDKINASSDRKLEVDQLMRDAPKLNFIDVVLTLAAATDLGRCELGGEYAATLRAEARALSGGAA